MSIRVTWQEQDGTERYGELVDSDLDLKLGLVAMSQSILPKAGIDFTIVALCEVRPASPEQRNISIFRLWKD